MRHSMMKISIATILLFVTGAFNGLFAQTPYISGLSHTSATVDEQILISGINFSDNAGDWLVTFGAQSVMADDATANSIKATVPAGASTDNITVTNINTGLSAYSDQLFYISYGGANDSFDEDKLGELNLQETNGLQVQDICSCDFNGDGKNDLAVSHVQATFLAVFVNNSSIGNLDLIHNSASPEEKIELGFKTFYITCADLNGDQYADILASSPDPSGQDKVYVIENSAVPGTIQFENPTELLIPRVNNDPEGTRRNPGKVLVNDLDLDGKPDLIIANNTVGELDIFRNISAGSISFITTPTQIVVEGASKLFGLDVKDLNNDGLPDIGVTQEAREDLFIIQNVSEPGNIGFKQSQTFEVSENMRHLKFGDFNGDGFMDAAIADQRASTVPGNVAVLKNTTSSSGEEISFGSSVEYISGVGLLPWGIDLSDVDGDKDLDIVVSSASASDHSIYVIPNRGVTTGNLFDDAIAIDFLESNARNVKSLDLDGDARPDFVFTHKSDPTANGQLGAILNQNCISPQINPDGLLALCSGQVISLEATKTALGVEYVWSDGVTNPLPNNDYLLENVSTAGSYSVVLNDGNCFIQSNIVSIEIDPDAFPSSPNTGSIGSVCEGQPINFTADDNGAPNPVTYHWSGPGDFSSNEQNPAISEAAGSSAGDYYVYMTEDERGCISDRDTISVSVLLVPSISMINTDGNVYCDDGSSIELSVTDVSDKGDFDYQWLINGAPIEPAETGLSYEVTTPGSYTVTISDSSACTKSTAVEVIEEIDPPTISFESDDSKCIDNDIEFMSESIGQSGYTLTHSWDFGDGTMDEGRNVTYAYSAAGSYTVTLNSTYDDVNDENCAYVAATKEIEISQPPTGSELDLIRDLNDSTGFQKCPSSAVRLKVIDGPYDSIFWRLESLGYALIDESPYNNEQFSVAEEETLYASVKDILGCEYDTEPVTISNIQGSGIEISGDGIEDDLDRGKIINMDEGQTFVDLSINGSDPIWTPDGIFVIQDTAINVRAFPVNAEESIVVMATDVVGCLETDSVLLISPPLEADKSFSPNGDGINDCWEITGVHGNTCQVTIFDSKGRVIEQVSTTPSELNEGSCVWDGTANGSNKMPPGVYYYVLKCTGDNPLNNGGTILLAR